MAPAVGEAEKLRFHTLNVRTGNRVVIRYVDVMTGRRVRETGQTKGCPCGESDLVPLEDDNLDAIALNSVRAINIEMSMPAGSIGRVWYDAPYYLIPSDRIGEEAFSVIAQPCRRRELPAWPGWCLSGASGW